MSNPKYHCKIEKIEYKPMDIPSKEYMDAQRKAQEEEDYKILQAFSLIQSVSPELFNLEKKSSAFRQG